MAVSGDSTCSSCRSAPVRLERSRAAERAGSSGCSVAIPATSLRMDGQCSGGRQIPYAFPPSAGLESRRRDLDPLPLAQLERCTPRMRCRFAYSHMDTAAFPTVCEGCRLTRAAPQAPSCSWRAPRAVVGTAVFTLPLMAAVQLMCARVGMVTGQGLAGVLRRYYPRWVLLCACALLLVANTVNIGADLRAMAAVVEMLTGVAAPAGGAGGLLGRARYGRVRGRGPVVRRGAVAGGDSRLERGCPAPAGEVVAGRCIAPGGEGWGGSWGWCSSCARWGGLRCGEPDRIPGGACRRTRSAPGVPGSARVARATPW